ncbi:hypothetical protein OG474_31065 [Kribbella sp. NBC_01505]|uniref:hypothetical protein n=1 Tax=Kribbella sp. NBC_01505 TaxID=2903580 RepID=UPI00386DC83F
MISDVLAAAGPPDLTHVNLVPFYDPKQEAAYREFLTRYADQMAPTFISFDHYPLASTQLRSVAGDPAVLGQFRTAADDGRRRLFVANRRYGAAASVTITVQAAVGAVEEFVPASGAYQPVTLTGAAFRVSVEAGSGRLFRLTGAP